ncbi:MAG TPA: FMN-binding domain-containing protein [Ruminococcaceae bacterium]|nr:FMN-binding domain-containing protein [Oscillospiraceae bacterium]
MKRMLIAAAAVMALSALAGCGSAPVSYTDGTYEARSAEYINDDGSEDGNGYGIVKITISGGAISDCTFTTYELDGTEKGEDYGKKQGSIANKDFYNKAQKAVGACEKYAEELVLSGDPKSVDAISGATINYGQFVEAAENALAQAVKKE